MAAVSYPRHPTSYATHSKALPITMPSGKAPVYRYPVSRVDDSPELSETTTSYAGSRPSAGSYSARSGSSYAPSHSSGDYSDNYSRPSIDIMDELSDRMNAAFDPIRMDKALAKQTQTSGELNAKHREIAELQALAQRRLKSTRVNFAEAMDAGKEARHDIEYSTKKMAQIKTKTERKHPEAYAKASRSRHA